MQNDSPGPAHGQCFIGGLWREATGAAFERRDPWYGRLLWLGRSASPRDVSDAVGSARRAFSGWRRAGFEARAAIAGRFADRLRTDKARLADLLGEETGKPLWEAATEIDAMAAKVALSIQAWQERSGETEKEVAAGHSVLRHRPHGVLAVFGPYNFPGHLPNGHIVPALLAGNTLVFKPSELTPRFAEVTVGLWQAAGLPDGVLNLVQGGVETGKALAAEDIDGLLFTGSSRTGELLHHQFGGRPDKLLALEMGGNNPLVLAGDWPDDAALHHVLFSAFVSAGQRCTCARRLIVPAGERGDRFLTALVDAAERLRCGAYDADPAPFMGCLITSAARDQVLAARSRLLALGGRDLLAPRAEPHTALLTPAIVDVTSLADPPDEEVFGPLLQVQRAADFEQALILANRTRYGLAAGLISDDRQLWRRFSEEIRAGIVNWNKPLTGASSAAPFGGVGASGNHRPSAWYAADYCAYPMASLVADLPELPATLPPGMVL